MVGSSPLGAPDPRSHATQAPDSRSHATQAPDSRSHATQAPDSRSHATQAPDRTVFGHVRERFETRAKALVYARLALMAIGLVVLALPSLRQRLAVTLPEGAYVYVALLVSHIASFLYVGRRYAQAVVFVSLCVDLLVLLFVIVASGGIQSPLMPAQLVYTMLFALLYPRPLAITPPLLTLPVLATVSQILGTHRMPDDLLMVLWYSALNITVVYLVVYLESRERIALQALVALQRQRRKEALDSQRSRIAREIHDGVGAALSGVLLQAEYLVSTVKDETIAQEVSELREAAAEGMDELRRAVSILHQEFQLTIAVPEYARSFAGRQHLAVESEVSGVEPTLSPALQLATFRILQEALSNVARHASAKAVWINLAFEEKRLVLSIEDDGQGFDPGEAIAGHYGLRNMAERSVKVGGQVEVDSEPGRGTRVVATLPTSVEPPATEEIVIR